MQDLDRTDDFESKYNFRFEEAAADRNGATLSLSTAAGVSHNIVHYARGSNHCLASHAPGDDNILRRKDESRQRRRVARRERKFAERRAKEERLRRLKNARRDELEERMERVRCVLGTSGRRMGVKEDMVDAGGTETVAPALGCAEEDMILKLMEGDYDPENFERVMASAYSEKYYQAEEKVWKTEEDVQRDLIDSGEVDGDLVGYRLGEGEESGDAAWGNEGTKIDDGSVEKNENNYDTENYPNDEGGDGTGNNAAQQPRTMSQKLQSKVQDELYKLDYEDIIGDMPTRFKYRTVAPNNYGLSTEEILFSRDSTLKQFVSLKKMAPYIREEEEYRPGTKQRKRFRKMVKIEKESEECKWEERAPDDKDGICLTDSVDCATRKKKRRRQKKGRNKVANVMDGGSNIKAVAAAIEEAKRSQEREEEPGKKCQRRRKKKGWYDSAAGVEVIPTDAMVSQTVGLSPRKDGSATMHNSMDQSVTEESKKIRKEKMNSISSSAANAAAAESAERKKHRKKKKKQKQKVKGVSGARLAAYGI